MRFAIATVDGYLGVFTAFVHAGWTPVKLFSVPVRNEFGNQQAVIAFAEQNKAAIQLSRMNKRDLQRLRDDGCEILIVASYDWKILRLATLSEIRDQFPFLAFAGGARPVPRAPRHSRKSGSLGCCLS